MPSPANPFAPQSQDCDGLGEIWIGQDPSGHGPSPLTLGVRVRQGRRTVMRGIAERRVTLVPPTQRPGLPEPLPCPE